jgi:hypothetical protein
MIKTENIIYKINDLRIIVYKNQYTTQQHFFSFLISSSFCDWIRVKLLADLWSRVISDSV